MEQFIYYHSQDKFIRINHSSPDIIKHLNHQIISNNTSKMINKPKLEKYNSINYTIYTNPLYSTFCTTINFDKSNHPLYLVHFSFKQNTKNEFNNFINHLKENQDFHKAIKLISNDQEKINQLLSNLPKKDPYNIYKWNLQTECLEMIYNNTLNDFLTKESATRIEQNTITKIIKINHTITSEFIITGELLFLLQLCDENNGTLKMQVYFVTPNNRNNPDTLNDDIMIEYNTLLNTTDVMDEYIKDLLRTNELNICFYVNKGESMLWLDLMSNSNKL